jgi:hypothetical protein
MQVCQETINILGYCVEHNCIRASNEKLSAIQKWTFLGSKRQLQRFLGFINYMHHHIPNFSTLVEPIQSLLT